MTEKEKFLEKVYPEPNTGCWLWSGPYDKNGYGRFHFLNRTIQLTHRYSYYIFNKPIDSKSHVLHICDNPACVNPDHLYLGDQRQNNIDRDKRGRQVTKRGSSHKLAKLTEHDSIQIRFIYKTLKTPTRKLANQFGVSQGTIMKILKGVAWPHTI